MFDCFGCGQRYDFLRGVALPGPATFCHKCEKRREAGLTDDEVAIAAAKNLVACSRCGITGPYLISPCGACQQEEKENLEPRRPPAMSNNIAPPSTMNATGLASNTPAQLAAAQLLRGAAVSSSQSSNARFGHTVQYVRPLPGFPNPSLDSARCATRGPLFGGQTFPGMHRLGTHTMVARPSQLPAQMRHKIQMWVAVYPTLPAEDARSKEPEAKELKQMQDGFASLLETDSASKAIYSLADELAAEYNVFYAKKYGHFPSHEEMIFQIPYSRRYVMLKKEWLTNGDGTSTTISALLNVLKAMRLVTPCRGSEETLRIRLIFHQRAEEVDINIPPTIKHTSDSLSSKNTSGKGVSDSPGGNDGGSGEATANGTALAMTKEEVVKRGREDLSDDELIQEQPPAKLLPKYNPFDNIDKPDISYTCRKLEYVAKYTATAEGDIIFSKDYTSTQILIADNWILDMINKVAPGDGGAFLGNGAYKFCMRAIFNDQHMAVFQLRPDEEGIVTPEDNQAQMGFELSSLVKLKFWNDRCQDELRRAGYIPPDCSVNVEDAFIGKLDLTQEPDCGIGCILTESPVEDGPGKGALPFAHFLAVRLLPIDGVRYKEERYVPPHGISANGTDTEDYLGMLVHYAYRESKRHFLFGDLQGVRGPGGQVTLFDPQCHICIAMPADKRRAQWDRGPKATEPFDADHRCAKYCGRLYLNEPPAPLPTGRPRPRPRIVPAQRTKRVILRVKSPSNRSESA